MIEVETNHDVLEAMVQEVGVWRNTSATMLQGDDLVEMPEAWCVMFDRLDDRLALICWYPDGGGGMAPAFALILPGGSDDAHIRAVRLYESLCDHAEWGVPH